MASHYDPTRSCVLQVTVTNLIYPVTVKVLGQLFDVYGVNDMCLLHQSTHLEAFVEFQSWYEASKAQGALHGRCIYDGCCLLDIQHAPLSISVMRLPNSEPAVVDWDQVEVAPLASSTTPSASTSATPFTVMTSAPICEVFPKVRPAMISSIVNKALDVEVMVALPTPHDALTPATTKVSEAREEVLCDSTGCVAVPVIFSIECLSQARWTSSDEGFRLSLVCLLPHPPRATEIVFVESQGGVLVPSRPPKPPDPTQGTSVCNLILDFTIDNLTLVQFEKTEWDPGIIQRPFQNNLNLDETYEVKFLLVLSMQWFIAYINDFSSSDISFDNNYASCENGVSVGIGKRAEHELLGTLKSPMVLQYSRKSKSTDCLQVWCTDSCTQESCLYFQWYTLVSLPWNHLHHKDNNSSAAISVKIYCGQLPISQLCESKLTSFLYAEKLWDPGIFYVTTPTASMKCHGLWDPDCHMTKESKYKMEDQRKLGGIGIHSCLLHSVGLPNNILVAALAKGGHSWEEAQGKCTHICKFGGVCQENTTLCLTSSMRIHMEVVRLLDDLAKSGCSDAVLTHQLGLRCCLAIDQTWVLRSAENTGAQYKKHNEEGNALGRGNQQNTTMLVVISEPVLPLQGLQWSALLIVLEPHGVYSIALMPVVLCVKVLEAQAQWDPGGFLSTMGGENKTNHHEISWRLQRIGAQGYRLIVGKNDSAPWDPGIITIYYLALPVRVKARQPTCLSGNCKLLQHVHAIAWGQAMFCRGGSVTPDILTGPHFVMGC